MTITRERDCPCLFHRICDIINHILGRNNSKNRKAKTMNTLEAIKKRVTCRAYQPKQISEEALNEILKAGMAAPVASGRYDSMHITVVENEAVLKRIIAASSDFISDFSGQRKEMDFGVKNMIVVSGAPGQAPGMDYASAGCIVENMLIAATSMGIDNIVWAIPAIAISLDAELVRLLGIPEGTKPLLCASFGYAAEETPAKNHTIAMTRI